MCGLSPGGLLYYFPGGRWSAPDPAPAPTPAPAPAPAFASAPAPAPAPASGVPDSTLARDIPGDVRHRGGGHGGPGKQSHLVGFTFLCSDDNTSH